MEKEKEKSLEEVINDAKVSLNEIINEIGYTKTTEQGEMDGLAYYSELKKQGYSSDEINKIIRDMFLEK